MPAKSPIDISDTTLLISILVNGTVIKDYYPVVSVTISHEINRISHAEVLFNDGDLGSGTFPISDSADFEPGNEIEIKAGYVNVTPVSIFKGFIVKHGLEISPSANYNLAITCKHKAVQMTFNKKEAVFSNVADSDIITRLIDSYGLSSTVTSTSVTQETVFQKLATDWDFVLSRAELYGYIVTFNGDNIVIGLPKTDAAAVLRIANGESIRTFNAELNAQAQAPGIKASGWDIKNQAQLTASASEPAVNSQGNLSAKSLSGKLNQATLLLNSCTPMVQDELKAWADSNLLKMRLSALKGEVSFIGNAGIVPGSIIELDGVGARFNGNAFVTAVNHVIEESEWSTSVRFGLDNVSVSEKPNFGYADAAGLMPPIHGLQVGTVNKLFDDPDGQYRILVNLVSNAESQVSIWARLSNFYASSGFGAGFLPEIGDEVIVGFLENNPRYPVILGSLYSNSRKTPVPASDNNNYTKSITTKSKLKISFDDEKKITTIETPAGNTFMLNDDTKSIEVTDQNSNTVKMTSSGISLNSPKDVTIEATGNISLKATGKVNITAQQDVAVSGLNIANTANVGFTAKGNATAEVSAAGQTTIKGGIVMIN